MAKFLTLALIFLCFLTSGVKADDRCTGPMMLSRYHDAYLSLISETGQTQRNSAKALLVIVGDKNAKAMARQIQKSGQSIDEDRLLATMEDASEFAQLTLSGMPPSSGNIFQHSQNVDWLGDVYTRTGCLEYMASLAAAARREWEKAEAERIAAKAPKTKQEELLTFFGMFFGTVGLVGGTAYGVTAYRKSHGFRKKSVERMPRRPIKINMKVMYTNPDGDMQEAVVSALDISVGGMKVDWPDNNAQQGTTITLLETPIGQRMASVMWSNAYYAGIMFNDVLSKRELAIIEEETQAET